MIILLSSKCFVGRLDSDGQVIAMQRSRVRSIARRTLIVHSPCTSSLSLRIRPTMQDQGGSPTDIPCTAYLC